MSKPEADAQEWAEAFLTISAFLIATATISAWWFGLFAFAFSLAAAQLIRSLPNSPASQGETP